MYEALNAVPAPVVAASPLIVMVSGGSDSTALLMRCATAPVDPMDGRGPRMLERGNLCVLHVNHCLRGEESDGDEAFVRDLCAELGVACRVERVDVPALVRAGANMEEAARQVRYDLAWRLAGERARAQGLAVEAARIFVAHTADDRAETFLMRALSGSGLTGLVGMRPTRGIVVRPLIECTREELRDDLRKQGIGWREDSTNAGDEATRSFVRHHIVPAFEERNPAFCKTLGRTLDALTCEEDLLARLARELFARAALPARQGSCVLDARALAQADPALAPRCVRMALEQALGCHAAREARFEAAHLLDVIALARRGSGSCSLPGGMQVRMEAGALVMQGPDVADPPADVELPVPGGVTWGEVVLEAQEVPLQGHPAAEVARACSAQLQAEGMREGRDFVLVDGAVCGCFTPGATGCLTVGSPRSGERMRPFGLGASKLLSDVLPQAGVPARDRPWVPVVRSSPSAAQGVSSVWVGGIRLDERAAWSDKTTCLIQLSLVHI